LREILHNNWERNFTIIGGETSQLLGVKLHNDWEKNFTMIGGETSQ